MRKKPTVADIRAMKGKFQYTKLRVVTLDELAAAEAAGIDMVSVPPDLMCDPAFRDVAPTVFAIPGDNFYEIGSTKDYIRWAFRLLKAGADALYCNASLRTVRRLADEFVPVIGHVGLVPSRRTWTGGFKAVGKTAAGALEVWQAVKRYEEAGAFGAEIEVMPAGIAAEISKRTPLFMISMGGGPGCDCQYLFAEDVLGSNTGHVPRHAKRYRDFAAEAARLQRERIAAFSEYAAEVASGAYPAAEHLVPTDEAELEKFRQALG